MQNNEEKESRTSHEIIGKIIYDDLLTIFLGCEILER